LKDPIVKRTGIVLTTLLVASLVLAACAAIAPTQTEVQPPSTVVPATATPTQVPQKTLVICAGEEPANLFIYDNPSASAWSVLESIYDGPIDTVDFQPKPVILEELPTQANNGVELLTVTVTAGELVSNTEGDIVSLKKGTRVFPQGCTSGACAVEWDGTAEIQLTQMSATFRLKTGVNWSDGSPVTAEDSVYSFNVASSPDLGNSKNLVNKTASYSATDAQTVVWKGMPGYLTQNPSAFFFSPLPEKQLGEIAPAELSTSDAAAQSPMGWGPYTIDEWVKGDHIRLVKNLNYYRAAENLPNYDVVVYRFIGANPDSGLLPLVNGECDVMDSSVNLGNQVQAVIELQEKGTIKASFGQGPEWELLNLGIKPASYDDAYNPYADRQDFFGDVRTRQALAYCIDREQLVNEIYSGKSSVPATYLPPGHPFISGNLSPLPYDPQQGMTLLDEAGWKDADGDPATPRKSAGVENVLNGTVLSLAYVAVQSDLHRLVADRITTSLAVCGVEVKASLMPIEEAYAPAPDGPIFGRNFDLAEFAWTVGRFPTCYLYSSSEIPTAKNAWLGTKFGGVNFSGYSNAEYDKACSAMLSAGLSVEEFEQANAATQQILHDDLPVIPLFYHVHVLATRPDLCGASFDISSRSGVKDIEIFDTADSCN